MTPCHFMLALSRLKPPGPDHPAPPPPAPHRRDHESPRGERLRGDADGDDRLFAARRLGDTREKVMDDQLIQPLGRRGERQGRERNGKTDWRMQ